MIKQFSLHNIIAFLRNSISLLHKNISIVLILVCALTMSGCSFNKETVVLTAGFNDNELFKIEDDTCYLNEGLVYLTNIKNRYVSTYGEDILKVKNDGVLIGDSIKDMALADISQIKAMNLEAVHAGMTLSENDEGKAIEAGHEYFSSLTSHEIDYLMVSEEDIINMYREYALASDYYKELIKDINPEISDDDARTITVQHIFLKTYRINENGERIDFSYEEKANTYERARMIHNLATDGEHNFEDLVYKYTEGSWDDYSFSQGEAEPTFSDAAFNLGKNEISDIVETQYGYHIIKCISTFNKGETDANKVRITEEKRQEVFGVEFDKKAGQFITEMNYDLWNSVDMDYDPEMITQSFFEIYHKYFD